MKTPICFRVVQEPYGWSVRLGEGMMTPFPSRLLAIAHATGLSAALRQAGEAAEVIVDDARLASARARGRWAWARVRSPAESDRDQSPGSEGPRLGDDGAPRRQDL